MGRSEGCAHPGSTIMMRKWKSAVMSNEGKVRRRRKHRRYLVKKKVKVKQEVKVKYNTCDLGQHVRGVHFGFTSFKVVCSKEGE